MTFRFERNGLFLLVILSVAVILRLGYVLSLEPRIEWFDGLEYERLARGLRESWTYSDVHGNPTAYWPPGYPAFLALLNSDVTSTRVTQSLLGVLTVLVGYGIARQFLGKKKALVAALFLAIYPLHVFSAGTILPAALLNALVAGLFLLLVLALGARSRASVFAAGVLGGTAALTAPVVLSLVGLGAIWFLIERPGKRGLSLAVLFLLPVLVIVGAWTVRNYRQMGQPVPISLNGGYNFWLGNFPGSTATTGNRELPGQREEEAGLRAARAGEVELDRAYFRKGVEHVLAEPGRFVRLSLAKAATLWNLYPTPATREASTAEKVASILSYGVLLPFGLYWLFRNIRRSPLARLSLLFFIAYTVVHALTISKVRFRLPLDTLVVVMAVGGLADLARRLGWRVLED